MKKMENLGFVFTLCAGLGIIGFWGAGFNGENSLAAGIIFGAGICAWVGLGFFGLGAARRRNGYY